MTDTPKCGAFTPNIAQKDVCVRCGGDVETHPPAPAGLDKFSLLQGGEPAFTIDSNGCWLWNGAVAANGYGQRKWRGKFDMAHRAFFEKYVGPIPEAHDLDHLCRVRRCVNPHHLEPVTRRENLRRGNGAMVTRGRTIRTTPEQRDAYVAAIAAGRDPKDVAREVGVKTNIVHDWMRVRGVPRV